MQASPPTQFLQTFQQMRGQWFAAVQGPAQTLFGLLALIEFAWSAAVLALERTDLQSWTAGLIRKLMWIGAFYALLVFGPTWIPAIVDSFTQLGQQASGVGPLQPGAVFQRGLDLGGALFGGASNAGFLANFGTAMAMVFAAILTFVAFCFISIQLVAALVESYIVVAAAFFFLGFGGSRWSAPSVEKYIALAVGVGVKIMILFLLIGVGMALSAGWVAVAQTVATSPNPAMGALDIVGESLIFLALCWFVPKIVAGVLGASPAFTGGEIIAVATPIVYGSVMAGKAAVSLATSGYSALAGAGQGGGGALTASVAPPGPSGPPDMNSSNGSSGQPGPPPLFATTTGTGQPPPPTSPKTEFSEMLMQQPTTLKTPTKAAALAPWQQSLLEARSVAKMALGREAGVRVAERHSGIYRGLIIGHTRDHVIQQIGNRAAAVIHAKERFPAPQHPNQFPWPEVGHRVSIHYSQSRAVARETRERVREQGRTR